METIVTLIQFASFALFCVAFPALLREIWIWRKTRQPKVLSALKSDDLISNSISRSRIISREQTEESLVKWPKTGVELNEVHEVSRKVDALFSRQLQEIDNLVENSGAAHFPAEMLASLYRINQEMGVAVEHARGYLPESPSIERRPASWYELSRTAKNG